MLFSNLQEAVIAHFRKKALVRYGSWFTQGQHQQPVLPTLGMEPGLPNPHSTDRTISFK